MFNEVSLFTLSKGTHGFDVTVPKSYLKYIKPIVIIFAK